MQAGGGAAPPHDGVQLGHAGTVMCLSGKVQSLYGEVARFLLTNFLLQTFSCSSISLAELTPEQSVLTGTSDRS